MNPITTVASFFCDIVTAYAAADPGSRIAFHLISRAGTRISILDAYLRIPAGILIVPVAADFGAPSYTAICQVCITLDLISRTRTSSFGYERTGYCVVPFVITSLFSFRITVHILCRHIRVFLGVCKRAILHTIKAFSGECSSLITLPSRRGQYTYLKIELRRQSVRMFGSGSCGCP
jgi:hypothetical protein